MKRFVIALALLLAMPATAPAQEQVRATPHKQATHAPAREKPVDMSVLPVSCTTVRWYHDHVSKGILDAMEKKYKPIAAQRRAGQACLNGAP